MELPTHRMWGPIWLLETVQQYWHMTILQGGCDLASLSPEKSGPISDIPSWNLNSAHVAVPIIVG